MVISAHLLCIYSYYMHVASYSYSWVCQCVCVCVCVRNRCMYVLGGGYF